MIELALDIVVSQGDFNLEVVDRSRVEVVGLIGPSGSGKTTLLEAIAGLRAPERGEIAVDGRVLYSSLAGIDVPARQRRIGYVPQDGLLFPHLSVRGNVLYGATADAVDLAGLAAMLEIDGLLQRRVNGLSGGERQRIALARALMTRPALLLMDEPLAAVDRARRDRILPYLLRIRRGLHVPLVYVSHDLDEIRQVADHVIVMDGGRVLQAGPPTATIGG